MTTVLIVEDGTEYRDFFELFLAKDHDYLFSQAGHHAIELLEKSPVDFVVLDMRFERSPAEDLFGDVEDVAKQYFGSDLARAHRFVEENQGTIILAEMRKNEHDQPVLFVSDMASKRLENLCKLYGAVHAVPNFDAGAIRTKIRDVLGADE
jgi:CheY-like chemotaxis protein